MLCYQHRNIGCRHHCRHKNWNYSKDQLLIVETVIDSQCNGYFSWNVKQICQAKGHVSIIRYFCLWSDLLSVTLSLSGPRCSPGLIWPVAGSGGNANISWGIIVQQISNRNSIWQSKLQRLSQNTTDDGDMCKNIVQCFAGLLAPDISSSSRMS